MFSYLNIKSMSVFEDIKIAQGSCYMMEFILACSAFQLNYSINTAAHYRIPASDYIVCFFVVLVSVIRSYHK
uniref:Uncharacterized protein n=1 Tax=Arion vulgaris TaxID=1028688 RepID=A0A0B6ZXT6_9EUPU